MKSLAMSMLIFTFMALPDSAWALRCGRLLVEIGDHKIDVLRKCGPPTTQDRRTGVVGEKFRFPRRTLDVEKYEEVVIDEWVYNFGPRQFMQYLRFENGILKKISDLNYGY